MATNDNLDEEFEKAFQEEVVIEQKPQEVEVPKEEPKVEEKPVEEVEPKEEPKEEEKEVEGVEKPEPKEEPEAEKTPELLTKDDIKSAITDVLQTERTSGQALESMTKEVIDVYYPKGLSNVLVDESTGKELRSPQDVVDASGDSMSIEEAAKWLMNEQYKLDRQVDSLKQEAKAIAETTLKFRQDGEVVLQKYDPIFKAYPHIQEKVWTSYSKLVKQDKDKGVILSAPDMQEYYDLVLEPYKMAIELGQQTPATNPVQEPAKPEPPKPSAEDRMDISGDGGTTAPDDPNDFAQQVKKELNRGL